LTEACRENKKIVAISHVNNVLIQPHWRSHEELIKQQVASRGRFDMKHLQLTHYGGAENAMLIMDFLDELKTVNCNNYAAEINEMMRREKANNNIAVQLQLELEDQSEF